MPTDSPQFMTSHLKNVQNYDRFKKSYLGPTVEVMTLSSHFITMLPVLGIWQITCIYNQLQHPAVT